MYYLHKVGAFSARESRRKCLHQVPSPATPYICILKMITWHIYMYIFSLIFYLIVQQTNSVLLVCNTELNEQKINWVIENAESLVAHEITGFAKWFSFQCCAVSENKFCWQSTLVAFNELEYRDITNTARGQTNGASRPAYYRGTIRCFLEIKAVWWSICL